MALTSLEAIAEKLADKRKEDLESILSISGSSAISKNDYGVNIVDVNNVASSLLFKQLTKPKQDDVELIKAIDVIVTELKPNIPIPNLDLVPRPLYTEQVTINEDLRKQVADLNIEVTDLTGQVTTLTSEVETQINNRLNIEQTNDALVNQTESLIKVVGDFSTQIQNAVQKSVDESILRASLQAQNTGFKAQINALIKQIDSLNAIIEGLQSQLGAVQQQQAIQQSTAANAAAAGADAFVNAVTAKFEGESQWKQQTTGLFAYINAETYGSKWMRNGILKLTNNDKLPVKINMVFKSANGWNWLVIPKNNFDLAGGESDEITFGINSKVVPRNAESTSTNYVLYTSWGSSTIYEGTLKLTITKADGTTQSKDYPAGFQKTNPGSYGN
jgi:predicted  nucleic acid-binding Zn-ribbon protein